MPITDLQARNAKPGEKLIKLSDGGGLQLWVTPDGAKRWRLAYRFAGKQQTLSIGPYPVLAIREAREAREAAKKLLAAGRDPPAEKRAARAAQAVVAANTFDAIADELLAKKRREAKAGRTLEKLEWLLGVARPALGARPVSEITPTDVLATLRLFEARGKHEAARKLRAIVGQVFRYAIATGRATVDPTASLKGALTNPVVTPRAAIIEPKAFGGLLRAIAGYNGAPETKAALELLALTFVRPGELRTAEWSEFDLDTAVWEIPAAKMKMRRPHRVPLAPRTLALLRDLERMTGHGRFLFPSIRSGDRCMSENTINGALRRLGFAQDEMTGHGFRASAASMLNEAGLWHPDAIERQLAHVDKDSVRRAYARAGDERVKMMQWWAERLDAMRAGGKVVKLRA